MKTTGGKWKRRSPEDVKLDFSILAAAKAYLCWDTFPDLSIQLVEMQDAVSFYYPPGRRGSIVCYTAPNCKDVSIPLFHLFHEAGHHEQYTEVKGTEDEARFRELVDTPTGEAKAAFEQISWKKGRKIFARFLEVHHLPTALLAAYDRYGRICVESYR